MMITANQQPGFSRRTPIHLQFARNTVSWQNLLSVAIKVIDGRTQKWNKRKVQQNKY